MPSERFHEPTDATVALAARLSVGDGSALCEPRRAGAQSTQCGEMPDTFLDRPADVPGRLGLLPRAPRPDPHGRRGFWHRHERARSPSLSATCRWVRAKDEARDAIRLFMLVNRRVAARADSGRTRQGVSAFFQSKPSSAFNARSRVTPDELGRGMGRRQAASAADRRLQWQAVRARRCRHRHDLRLPNADRTCGQDRGHW